LGFLEIESLVVEYRTRRGTIRAVDNLSFSMGKTEMLGLVGESGSGKSTMGLSLLRLLPLSGFIAGGRVLLDGQDLLSLPEEQMRMIRGRRIGYVFQDPMTSLNPVKEIGDHFVELIRTHEPETTNQEALERAKRILIDVGIMPDRIHNYPHQFSGGMRQRIMIALAIALRPELVIADEPTTALDVIVQAKILDLLTHLRDYYGAAIILITHDLGVTLERCDSIAVMYAAQLMELATAKELHRNTLHPYTIALLKSIPNVELNDQCLKAIPGSPPDLFDLPKGCKFWPRCSHAMERCKSEEPRLLRIGDRHQVRCFLYEGEQA